MAKRSSDGDPRVAYPEAKVQVRDIVRVVGIVAHFAPRGQYSYKIRFIEKPGIQVRFINLIPMHFFHKSLHTPWCIPPSTTR